MRTTPIRKRATAPRDKAWAALRFRVSAVKAFSLVVSALALVVASEPARADHALKKSDGSEIDWAGLYGGLAYGVAIPATNNEHFFGITSGLSPAYDLYPHVLAQTGGVTAGAHAGYNWQKGRFVYGFETELNYLGGRHTPDGASLAPLAPYGLQWGPSASYFASIRGRAGYAVGPWLPYLTGGVAAGGARGPARLLYAAPGLDAQFAAEASQSSRMKFAVGAGLAYAIADSWSARLEYLYLNQQLQTQLFANGSGDYFVSRSRPEDHILRVGIDYHFGSENELREHKSGESEASHDHHHDHADQASSEEKKDEGEEFYSVHGQTTTVAQGYPKFRADYSGSQSFPPYGQGRVGETANLFMGLRLWEGSGVFLNPEIDQGYGVADSRGAAAYPNGAVAKLGAGAPYMRFQRYFLRQIIGLGGERGEDRDEGALNETLEATQNQLAGKVDKNRLVITVGKFAVGDVFDDNVYAHDPTTGFLNFAFNTMGAFDYAADAWGYTHGLAVEWKQNWWTARAGVFQLSKVPNGIEIEPELLRQYMAVAELEARYELFEQPGAIKFLAYGDNGRIANIYDVVQNSVLLNDLPPQLEPWHQRHLKTGAGVNIKQQIMPDLGFFMRGSWTDGRYETVDYTDVDRQLSFGLVAAGKSWGRELDEMGGGLAFGGLSGHRVRYFELGGTSVYIGDGALTYGGEKNLETYYKIGLNKDIDATFDYQLIVNPGHNAARGPANFFGLRLHAQF
jgi:high affinity Mn2+ porin